jgi:AraC-like DNA-binding protein
MVILEPISLLVLILATFSLLYSIAFLLKKRPVGLYLFMAGFSFLSITAIAGFFHFNRLVDFFPQFFGLTFGLLLLTGPLTFISFDLILYPSRKKSFLNALHLIPFLIYLVSIHPLWFLASYEKVDYINRLYADGYWSTNELSLISPRLELLVSSSLTFIYLIISAYLLFSFYRNTGSDVKSRNKHLLIFLKSDLYLKGALVLISISLAAFDLQEKYLMFLVVGVLVYLLWMFLLLMRSSDIASGLRPVQAIKNPPARLPDPVIAKSKEQAKVQLPQDLSDSPDEVDEPYTPTDQSKYLFSKIEAYMQTEKPFLDENFSRLGLADKMQVAPRKVTLTIHGETNFNFADYVNSYRIRHIEEQLRNGSEWRLYSVERLGKETGFNTRAAFNNALRRLRNLTPTELLRGGS